jgi:hypothetical protein
MKKTKFKKGDIVYWQDLQGEVIDKFNNSIYYIRVRFTNNKVVDFTNDGRCYSDTPPVLSHTPYTLNGFTQNEVIEKDTLVWVRMYEDFEWQMRYYSHFENGQHYCFVGQLTSNQTEGIESWTYLETTNPLIK